MSELDRFGLCENTLGWDQLGAVIRIERGSGVDYSAARSIADRAAAMFSGEPMLLAWYDAKTGNFFLQGGMLLPHKEKTGMAYIRRGAGR